jgi:ATP-dependent Clp protease ATP-binding subunit ClpX
LPVIATLHELNEEALIDILTKPKNSLVKQYQKLFEMDGVKVKFTRGALTAVARQALDRNSGARGLRAILESAMLEIMYDVPSRSGIKEVVVSER